MLLLFFDDKRYNGESAVDILRKLECDSKDYLEKGEGIRQFLLWSLERLGDRLPVRELLLTDDLNDEMLALSYLCLLDQYGLAELDTMPIGSRHAGS